MTIRLRQWAALSFVDPIARLVVLRKLEQSPELALADDAVRRLRTNGLRELREGRIAYLFAVGMQSRFGVEFSVAVGEGEDFDFVVRTVIGDETHYIPVQLKELAPADLNPNQTLEDLFLRIQRRPSSDTVLLVHLNRRERIEYIRLATCRAPFREVWFLWASNSTQNDWSIFGDVLV